MFIIKDMRKATANFLVGGAIAFHQHLIKGADNIMAYERDFGANEKTIDQKSLPENTKEQTLKIMLVGSPEAVKSGIRHFYLKGEAQVSDWSRFLPSPSDPDEEVMSILFRKITVH